MITEIQGNFELTGHKVQVFLAGDYDFLSKYLGHQGQSSSYPLKDHNSVIDTMIFPIKCLHNTLNTNIHLGIVLELFDQLESECKKVDETSNLTEQNESLNEEIKTEDIQD